MIQSCSLDITEGYTVISRRNDRHRCRGQSRIQHIGKIVNRKRLLAQQFIVFFKKLKDDFINLSVLFCFRLFILFQILLLSRP